MGEKTELARKLREHRKSRRLTGPEVARELDVTQGTISKIENGRFVPTIDFLSKFAHRLRLNRIQTEELVRLAGVAPAESDAADFLRFLPYDFLNVDWASRRQRVIASSERAAGVIRTFQPLMVPGLLQTEAYARHVFRLAGITNPQQLERSVRARVHRQRVLSDRRKRFIFVLNEGALHAPLGTLAERDGQVQHLLALTERSNLRIGLIPANQPLRVGPPPAFYVFDDARVYIELPHGDLWLLEPSHAAAAYLATFEKLRDSAAFGDELVAKVEQIRRRLAA